MPLPEPEPNKHAPAPDSDLLSGLNPDEQVMALQALRTGTLAILQLTMKYVREYHELIEEDLDDRPDLTVYLQRARKLLFRADEWTRSLQTAPIETPEFDELDLGVLLAGIVKRCQTTLDVAERLTFDPPKNDRMLVRGALFLLQDMFVRLLNMGLGTEVSLTVSVEQRRLDSAFMRSARSECSPGAYVLASIARDDPFNSQRAESFLDAFLGGCFIDALRETNRKELDLLPLYGIVRMHGGDVFINRDGDTVVAVAIALPAVCPREEMQAPRNIAEGAPVGQETILLVDDEDMIWDVIIDMLQELGYSVILAGNGLEAVEVYRENPGLVDLVMLDMVMPELDGHGTFFKLREIDPEVRVLLSSGYVSEEDARDVLEAGAAGFLQKPYRMVDLARRVRTIFDNTP
ncbi:MAG: response regulator [bacterium]